MTHAPHITTERLTTEHLHTLIAHLRLWVLELALWFAELCGDTPIGAAIRAGLREDLQFCRRCLAAAVLLLALRRYTPPPQMRRARRPANAPRGVRRPHNLDGSFRVVTRLVPGGRSLRARCAALREAADNTEALIARMIARLDATPVAAYIMAHAPRDTCMTACLAPPAPADSS